ncbi:hypothetical protein H4R33_006004 [Dimargaris cristalligena]|nr:hypothetical protein H4R33_006004 [Dimargaris cristalligena]
MSSNSVVALNFNLCEEVLEEDSKIRAKVLVIDKEKRKVTFRDIHQRVTTHNIADIVFTYCRIDHLKS